MTDLLSISPRNIALLLIEYQNDFATEGGSLHDAVADVMAKTNMVNNSSRLVREARESGAIIVHAPLSFEPGYEEISGVPYGILKGVVDTNAFERDTWGVEIVDWMQPEPNDVTLTGKRGLDSFASTNLDFELKSRNIENLAIAGFLTNCCIESTMRSGYELGYNVMPVVDCMAATSMQEHETAIEHNFPRFSNPVDHESFLGSLSPALV